MSYMYIVPLEYWEPHDYICCIVKQNNQSCISTAKLKDNTREKLQRSIIVDKSSNNYKKMKKSYDLMTKTNNTYVYTQLHPMIFPFTNKTFLTAYTKF